MQDRTARRLHMLVTHPVGKNTTMFDNVIFKSINLPTYFLKWSTSKVKIRNGFNMYTTHLYICKRTFNKYTIYVLLQNE